MLKRLGTLVAITLFWLVAALIFPIAFWVIGGLILGGTLLHMVLDKQGFGAGHRFFAVVAATTLLLATAGFFVGRGSADAEPLGVTTRAAVDDAIGDDEEEIGADTGHAGDAGELGTPPAEVGPDTGSPVDVTAALRAANAARKGKACKSLETVAAAWADLSRVPADDEQFTKAKRAAAALEKCRKKAVVALTKGATKTRAKERAALAKQVQRALAELGLRLKAKPGGKAKDKLTLKGRKVTHAAVDEVFAGGATDEGSLLGRLQQAGFTKVSLAAGKVKRNWELEPPADEDAARATVEELGMAEPLTLE